MLCVFCHTCNKRGRVSNTLVLFGSFCHCTLKWPFDLNLCGLPCWLSSKESAFNAGDAGLIPGLGRSLREGNGNPLQYSFLENSMVSLAGCNPLSHKELDMPEHTPRIYILFVLYVCTYITQLFNRCTHMYMSIYMSCMYMCVYMYKTALLHKCICVKDPAE